MLAWISDCCLLLATCREAEERWNHENKINVHRFPGTLIVCTNCVQKGPKRPSKVKVQNVPQLLELAGACHWLQHEMARISKGKFF